MWKKINIIMAILMVIMIACLAIYGMKNYGGSQKAFTLCEIKTYDGELITDYSQNKRAFVITNYDASANITVNGEKYEPGLGIYCPGKYEVEIATDEGTEKRTIQINELEKEKRNEYNVFLTAETLPTLFASFDMIKEKDVPSFVWFQREGTLNVEALKSMFSDIVISEHVGQGDNKYFRETIVPEVQSYVADKLKNDPNAHFTVYVTAEYYWMEIATLEKMGLNDSQVDVVMYSCGTVDYVVNYEIAAENSYDVFVDKKAKFDEALDKARSNLCADDVSLTFLKSEKRIYDHNYVLINSLRENVEYYLQFPELIKFADSQVDSEMQNANMNKIVAKDEFKELTADQRMQFFKCIDLDKQEFDEEYFNMPNGKYLIITGTRPFYGKYHQLQFEQVMNQVIEKYGKDYTILFKPHPKAIPEGAQADFLNNKGIKILPGVMPMEAIAFVYDGLKLGGFASSLYMSVDEGSTLFFFSDNKEDLVEPLNVLYDDLFKEAEFMVPSM